MSLSTGSTGSAVTGRQQFFEAAPDVLAIASFDGRLQDCNPAFTESLGWSLGELRGQSLLDLVHFGDRESTAAELAKLRQGAASVSFENRCRTHDGGFRRFAWAVSLAERQLFAVGREIVEFSLATRRSSTPASLTENDLLTNRVVYEGNPHSGELRYTEHIASLLGCDQSELSHGRWRELIHPDDRASYDQAIRENLARKRPFHLDYHLVRKDGTVIAVQDVGQFRFDADLNVTRVVGYVTPAVGWGSPTELERVTTYYRGLAECAVALNSTRSLNDIHQLITDQARSIIGAHQSVTSITVGADLAQAVNALSLSDKYAPWRSYSVVPDGSGIYAMICETNRTARMTQEQLESHPRWRGFGKERHAHPPMRGWLAAPLIGRDGKNLGLIQLSDKYEGEFDETDEAMLVQLAKMASVAIENARLYRDIEAARENLEEKVRERTAELLAANTQLEHEVSVRRTAESQLRVAKEAADAASRAKSTFLANMSHEIRTPMNSIIGMTELVLETSLSATQRDYLATVLDSAESLLDIINEILDFSKIEAGKLELHHVEFDLREELGSVLKSLGQRAGAKGIELIWWADPAVPNNLIGDPVRLRQILVNLVSNGIKFTLAGEVVVEVRLESSVADRVNLHFQVSDTGIGIPPEKLQHIFAPFEQVDGSTTRRFGGTGLGLAITVRLLEALNGRLWVESQVGRGSTFHFAIEFGIGSGVTSRRVAENATHLQDVPALVVDDNATNRRLLFETLHGWGMRVETAQCAEEALRMLEAQQRDGKPLPIVLTDLHMPGVDGFMFIERMRQTPALRDIRVIMLTSGGYPGDATRCERLRVSARLLKPAKQSELLDAIMSQVVIKEDHLLTSPAEAGVPGRPPLSRLRILLAEDSLTNQKLALGLLEQWGHQVVIANNGDEAVQAWESGKFDLVLMDVQMPVLDGLDATREIRRREKTRGGHTPVLALTARSMKGDREICLAAGMDGYLSKPMRRHELGEALASFFPGSIPSPGAGTHPAAESELVDWSGLLKMVGGDWRSFRAIAEACRDETAKVLAGLPCALAAGNLQETRRLAHTIRSTGQTFGALAVRDAAIPVEAAARQGDRHAVEAALPRLLDALRLFQDVVEQWLKHNPPTVTSIEVWRST